MTRHSSKQEIVDLVVQNLKKRKNLPFVIRTGSCPKHKPKCRKHHGEIVIDSYNKKTKKFHLKYYSTHERGIAFQYDQPDSFIKQQILHFLESRRKILTIKYLKKFLNNNQADPRKHVILLRYNDYEYEILKKKASKKNLNLTTYIRKRSIS